ncbi:MAG: YraN family protein [Nocardioidaceae bacterium]|nr:YraN family protein [Nocardioidaceae bacterium]
MTTTHARRKALGDFGERLAARRLNETGYSLLDRNWRCRDGEIDIVALDGDVLVVCEVKTRSTVAFGTPLEAIDPVKAARLHRLGGRWLHAHPQFRPVSRIRVDVIAILRRRRGAADVEHLVGVV